MSTACPATPEINHNKLPDEVRAAQIRDMKWGMFVCWAFSTFHGQEWTPTHGKDASYFKATGCDTDQWALTAKKAGMGGWTIPETAPYKKKVEKLMDVQLAVADPAKYPDFKGNVAGVETRGFQRTLEESPSKQDFHWLRKWETLYLIGKSMGDSMVGLLSGQPIPPAGK